MLSVWKLCQHYRDLLEKVETQLRLPNAE